MVYGFIYIVSIEINILYIGYRDTPQGGGVQDRGSTINHKP